MAHADDIHEREPAQRATGDSSDAPMPPVRGFFRPERQCSPEDLRRNLEQLSVTQREKVGPS